MIMRKKKGIILIFVYTIIPLLLVLAGITIRRGINELNLAKINKINTEALYLAEAGLKQIAYAIAHNSANHISLPLTSNDNDWTAIPGLPSGFLPPNFSLEYTCVSTDSEYSVTDSAGIITFVQHYKIRAKVTHSEYDVSVVLNQIIARNKTYTFQHAVFYEDDLEMLPGPNMTLSGRVHSNSDIYIGANNTLTIDTTYLYSAGNIYNERKDNGSVPSGDVSIKKKKDKPTDPDEYYLMKEAGDTDPLDSNRSDWTDESQNRWNGTVKSSVHGVTALAIPAVGSIQPDGYYAANAGLKITRKSDGSWEIYSGGSPLNMSDFPADTITESTFKDNREGDPDDPDDIITVVDIDIDKLNTSGHFPSNGLLYVTREDATSSQANGVRLKSGGELNGALTVVSNDPVYIKGDYNNTNKKPAAIICDAVNILSNSWDDSNDDFDHRDASDTEINAAFISGIVPTPDGGGNYSGGLENYPRLHESWSGKTLKIRGSFVELWESSIAQGKWHYGDPIYRAPVRDWDYDTDFNNSSNLPPFTPFAVEIQRIVWWKS